MQIQVKGSAVGATATVPDAPTGLTPTAIGQTQIDLTWTAPANTGGADITDYKIEVCAQATAADCGTGTEWSELDSGTVSTATAYSHKGLRAGTTRHYRVRAVNSVGDGAWSSVESATTAVATSTATTVTLPFSNGGISQEPNPTGFCLRIGEPSGETISAAEYNRLRGALVVTNGAAGSSTNCLAFGHVQIKIDPVASGAVTITLPANTVATDASTTSAPEYFAADPLTVNVTLSGNTVTAAATGVATTNTAPTASNKTVTTEEDTAYTFKASDFNFADADTGDALASVKIVTLPAAGDLTSDGTAVTANQSVTKADLDADKLKFTPAPNGNGDPYTTFTFKVSDGTDESTSAYTMTIDVTPVNDAPTVANAIQDQTATVGTAFSYAFPANAFSDADGDTLSYTATKGDGTALPSWLTFTPASRSFSGMPTTAATVTVKATADDRNGGTISDSFDIAVNAAAVPTVTIEAVVPSRDRDRTERDAAVFTLTRTGSTAASLTVTVTVSESGDMVAASNEGDSPDTRPAAQPTQRRVRPEPVDQMPGRRKVPQGLGKKCPRQGATILRRTTRSTPLLAQEALNTDKVESRNKTPVRPKQRAHLLRQRREQLPLKPTPEIR